METPWKESYPQGIPLNIEKIPFTTIVEMLDISFTKFKEHKAYDSFGSTVTFDTIQKKSQAFANYLLKELNLKKGDRVALMMPNLIQFPIALFGILQAGLTAVNVNPLYTAKELEHQMSDSGATAIIILENSANLLNKIKQPDTLKHIIVTKIGDQLDFPKSIILNLAVKHLKKMVPKWNLKTAVPFNKCLALGKKHYFAKASVSPEDIAFLQYTGGTTGVAKGAELTHRNVAMNLIQVEAWTNGMLTDGKEIVITALPMYHIFALVVNCFVFVMKGGHNVLITNPRDFNGFVNELKKWRFTCITAVNTLYGALLNHPEFKNCDFSELKFSLGGGMAVQENVATKYKKATGSVLVEGYGLTETSPVATLNPLNIPDFTGFVGLPISSTHITIKNDDEENLPFDEVGEICIKGPQVMKGYWNKPEETDKVMTKDGYLKTGDLGYMTDKGYIKIVDRKKDMILVSGFNVYPNEIEEVASTHPKVLECAAIGAPDERSGEVVRLFVVKKDESLTEEELIKHCRQSLTGYKVPKIITFRTEPLPKTNVGKILRKELRTL